MATLRGIARFDKGAESRRHSSATSREQTFLRKEAKTRVAAAFRVDLFVAIERLSLLYIGYTNSATNGLLTFDVSISRKAAAVFSMKRVSCGTLSIYNEALYDMSTVPRVV